jgi:hypothetical protein
MISPSEYTTLAVKGDARWKFELWQEYLTRKWGYKATHDMTLEYLMDNCGPPPEDEE